MDLSPNLTPLPWNGLVLYYVYRVSKGVNPTLQMEELQEACVKSTARMYLCKVCYRSFTRKDNLSRHMLNYSKKGFQCSHCSKCYSQQGKLKVHTVRHHIDVKPISSKKSLVCAYCSKMFGWSFDFKHHKKKSVEASKSDMEAMILEMTQAERQYRQKLEVGETVSTLLNSNEQKNHCQMNTRKLWRCNDSHKSSMCQFMRMPHWNHGKTKYWHSFNNLSIGRLFGSSAKREEKERPSFKITSSTTTAVDVWLWLTSLLVQRTLPISCQSFHWSARTSFSSITSVLQQKPLLMTCWKVLRMVTRSVQSMTHEGYFSRHLTL